MGESSFVTKKRQSLKKITANFYEKPQKKG
jgi:hypothetical protein